MLEQDFSLVMLAEQMDESLVLLAHTLCLPLHRVTVFRRNARQEDRKVMQENWQHHGVDRHDVSISNMDMVLALAAWC